MAPADGKQRLRLAQNLMIAMTVLKPQLPQQQLLLLLLEEVEERRQLRQQELRRPAWLTHSPRMTLRKLGRRQLLLPLALMLPLQNRRLQQLQQLLAVLALPMQRCQLPRMAATQAKTRKVRQIGLLPQLAIPPQAAMLQARLVKSSLAH